MADKDIDKKLTEDYGDGPGFLRWTLRGILLGLIVFIAATAFYSFKKGEVKAWEVGLRYWTVAIPGLTELDEPKILDPGYNLCFPWMHRIDTFEVSIQRFEMGPEYGAIKPDLDPLKVRTEEDQDEIDVYVTILFKVKKGQADELKKHYISIKDIKTKGIGAECPQILQYHLGRIMTANQFYSMSADRRKEIIAKRKKDPHYMKEQYPTGSYLLDRTTQATNAMLEMNSIFGPRGVEIVSVNIWDFKFKDAIEASIISKVIADEKVEMEKTIKKAADEKATWEKLVAEADAAAEAERARGVAEKTKIEAAAQKVMTESIAKGDRLIMEAEAPGKGKINEALAGRGGKTYVGLKYAESLKEGLDIIIVPASGKDGFNPLNMKDALKKIQPGAQGVGQ